MLYNDIQVKVFNNTEYGMEKGDIHAILTVILLMQKTIGII